jgi:Leucine-rich repeat (LRR) protein
VTCFYVSFWRLGCTFSLSSGDRYLRPCLLIVVFVRWFWIIDGNNLVGSIPPELKALSSLHHLNLASNTVRSLDVEQPGLDASDSLRAVAEFGGNLTSLDLSSNKLDATIPVEFAALSNLEVLHLEENEFKLKIPTEFSQLTNLKALHIQVNKLIGSIENAVEHLPNLEVLNADWNDFSISPDLRFPTSLRSLILGRNHFESFPMTSNVGKLSNLEKLGLVRMDLQGNLPTELGMMTELQLLRLEGNHLNGTFPWSSMTDATALRVLDLEFCNLTGQLPSDIGRFSSLELLDLATNFFKGSIPDSIGDLTLLEIFDAAHNFLIGTLPSTLGRLTSLQGLRLQFNGLTGKLPTEIMDMTSLGTYRQCSTVQYIHCGPDHKILRFVPLLSDVRFLDGSLCGVARKCIHWWNSRICMLPRE